MLDLAYDEDSRRGRMKIVKTGDGASSDQGTAEGPLFGAGVERSLALGDQGIRDLGWRCSARSGTIWHEAAIATTNPGRCARLPAS